MRRFTCDWPGAPDGGADANATSEPVSRTTAGMTPNSVVKTKTAKAVSNQRGMPLVGSLVPIAHAVKTAQRNSQPECPIAVHGSVVEHQHGISPLRSETGWLANWLAHMGYCACTELRGA